MGNATSSYAMQQGVDGVSRGPVLTLIYMFTVTGGHYGPQAKGGGYMLYYRCCHHQCS